MAEEKKAAPAAKAPQRVKQVVRLKHPENPELIVKPGGVDSVTITDASGNSKTVSMHDFKELYEVVREEPL